MLGGIGVRLWAMRTLGHFYTRTLRVSEEQSIVTQGPYRFIRHPGYLGTFLVWVGLGIAATNWIAAALVTLLLFLAYHHRMNVEEAMLVEVFEEGYRAYQKRTWRLLPLVY